MKRVSKNVITIMIAVLLLMFSGISAFAVESPSGVPEISVDIRPSEGGSGSYEFESDFGKGPNGGTNVHFDSKTNNGYTFDHWDINGNYTILEGSLNNSSLTVEAFSDLVATPYFKKNGSSGSPSAGGSVNTNTDKTSPQTGSSNLLYFAGAVVILAACGAFAVKRKIKTIEK